MKQALFLLFTVIYSSLLVAQAPLKPNSSDIYAGIKRAQVLGSVLYVAAHPDDENTQMISYFANKQHMYTTYLSLTRGDGGQNLIGPEIRELLGLIRTQELLQARSTDGGHQLFSRANDFGYSKHPDETLDIWNKDEVLADVIWAIRKTRPDIIIHRFDHRTKGTTHGHHTASAMLSYEAFELAGKENVYPEQLNYVSTWTPTRQFFNTSWWFYGSQEKFEKAEKGHMVSVDIGEYYPLKGKSNNEIAALSRSFHKSQGFGATGSRGRQMEYLEWIQGDKVTSDDHPMTGINTTWSRIEGGSVIGEMLAEVDQNFDLADPAASIPSLVEVYKKIQSIPNDGFWVPKKLEEIGQLIQWCSGLFIEAVAADFSASPGQSVDVELEVINRSQADMSLDKIEWMPGGVDTTFNTVLSPNEKLTYETTYYVPKDTEYSTPYWLNSEGTMGMYHVEDQKKRGLPEGDRPIKVHCTINVEGITLELETALVHKRNDPVKGEVYRPFEISPPVFANFQEDIYVFAEQTPKNVEVLVKSGIESLEGTLRLDVPDGWSVQPEAHAVHLAAKGQEATFGFSLVPPGDKEEIEVRAVFDRPGESAYSYSVDLIEYDHIPTQTVLRPATVKAVKLDLKKAGEKVGYVMGAGDKIPEYLEQIGYEVTLLQESDLNFDNLRQYDAVIMGIRAYNTNSRLAFYQDALLNYVENGGTMIVQYNTNRGFSLENLAPYPLKLSRDRVSVEEAPVRILAPDHPIVNTPNEITAQDFEGWVQERGLYFPNEWDEKYTAILSSNDPGEPPRDGGLLVAPYGKGWYIYTGYSWFRELPAGVPGAYRLFANLISIGNRKEP